VTRPGRGRIAAFALVCVVALAVAVGAVVQGLTRTAEQRRPTELTATDTALDPATVLAGPHIVFRSNTFGPTNGALAVVPLDRPDGPRAVLGALTCDRVDADRGGAVCLVGEHGAALAPTALVLDAELAPVGEIPLAGRPSRTRLSPDGRLAATTVFVTGHTYAAPGEFSTATVVQDLRTGASYGNLEEFRIVHEGAGYRAADVNVWGVTFAWGDRFYATVATQGRTYLAEGDLARRELRTLRDGVECPALSPDGTRIAYKSRNPGDEVTWRLHVLDLRTGADVALAEERDVDDQVEWLDDARVLYGMAPERGSETAVWVVPADGGGAPAVFLPRAWSPAVVP
jgi:hypothetical protein